MQVNQVNRVNNEQHVMILEATRPSGAEEWYCPTCGRRLLVTWAPSHKRVTLAQGDPYASHRASKGEGFSLGSIESVAPANDPPTALDQSSNQFSFSTADGVSNNMIDPSDEQLSVWQDWLQASDWGDF